MLYGSKFSMPENEMQDWEMHPKSTLWKGKVSQKREGWKVVWGKRLKICTPGGMAFSCEKKPNCTLAGLLHAALTFWPVWWGEPQLVCNCHSRRAAPHKVWKTQVQWGYESQLVQCTMCTALLLASSFLQGIKGTCPIGRAAFLSMAGSRTAENKPCS